MHRLVFCLIVRLENFCIAQVRVSGSFEPADFDLLFAGKLVASIVILIGSMQRICLSRQWLVTDMISIAVRGRRLPSCGFTPRSCSATGAAPKFFLVSARRNMYPTMSAHM